MPRPTDPVDLDQSQLAPEERSPLRPGWVKYVEDTMEAAAAPPEEPEE
jgi:hypothetical protein